MNNNMFWLFRILVSTAFILNIVYLLNHEFSWLYLIVGTILAVFIIKDIFKVTRKK